MLKAHAFDLLAGRSPRTFGRFMKRNKYVTLERTGLHAYYPFLRLVGYLPPPSIWEPTTPLSDDEMSTDLRRWFTPIRRRLISRQAIEDLCELSNGVLSRYLNNDPHVTFRYASLARYYPILEMVGYVPPSQQNHICTY